MTTDLDQFDIIATAARRLRDETAEARRRVTETAEAQVPSMAWGIDYMEAYVAAANVSHELEQVLAYGEREALGADAVCALVREQVLRSVTYTGPAPVRERRLRLAQDLGYFA